MAHHDEEPILLDRRAAARRLGIGTTLLDELIAADELTTIKIGRRRLVPAASLDAYVSRRLGAEAA